MAKDSNMLDMDKGRKTQTENALAALLEWKNCLTRLENCGADCSEHHEKCDFWIANARQQLDNLFFEGKP